MIDSEVVVKLMSLNLFLLLQRATSNVNDIRYRFKISKVVNRTYGTISPVSNKTIFLKSGRDGTLSWGINAYDRAALFYFIKT